MSLSSGSFTVAGEKDNANAADESYQCECIDCGYEMESEEHCRDIKCPECGGQMRRAERPGPGQKDLMEENSMSVKLNSKGRSNANSLIDSGKVDKTTSWSWSADDENKILGDPADWAAYTKWFMGTESEADSETKAHYKYPFGKNGKVYRSALIAIRQRAAQQDETDIYDSVGAMINKIDGNKAMSWFEIRAQEDGELSEIWIYDEIGYWGVTAKDFVKELNTIKSKKIDMHINSPGGDVFDGTAVYNAIKKHPAEVTTHIDGIAASIASVIALAGNRVLMAENAIYMLHNPWGMVIGNAKDMRKQADVLDKVRETMLGAYVTKSGSSKEDIISLLDAETWLSAEEAMEFGFIDDVSGKMDMAACAKFAPVMARMGFKKIPKILNPNDLPSAKDAEKALRDAGFSIKQAKTILSKGFSEGLRDVDQDDDPPAAPPRDVEPKKHQLNDRTQELLLKADLVSK